MHKKIITHYFYHPFIGIIMLLNAIKERIDTLMIQVQALRDSL